MVKFSKSTPSIVDFDSVLVFILKFKSPEMIWNLKKSLSCRFDKVPFKTSSKQWNLHQNPAFLMLSKQCIENLGRTVWHTCLPAILNQPSNQPLTCLITRIYWSFPMNLRITTNSSQCQLKLPKEIFCNLPSIDLPSFTVRGPSPFLGLFISQLGKKKLHFVKTNGLYNKIS